METETPDTALAKFPKLQPKDSFDEELAISKIHLSRSWKLPPRLKPGKRSQIKSKDSDEDECSTPGDGTKKRKQNRDAQRAYRERRANRLQELEGTVNSLQKAVKSWKQKCKDLETELQEAKKDNSSLKHQIDKITSNICSSCLKETCTCGEGSETLFQDPFLQNVMKHFKPMKAVTLKKRKSSSLKLSESSTPQPNIGSVISDRCGFCSDATTCVCKDLQEDYKEQQDLPQQQHFEEPVTATLGHCSSEEKGHCKNCADIDKSCLTTEPVPVLTETTNQKPKATSWVPGSCTQCQADPANKIFCKSVCDSASIMAAVKVNDNKDGCSLNPAFEPGSCQQCQANPQRKEFCQGLFSNGSQQSTVKNGEYTDLIPVGHAYERIKNHMTNKKFVNIHPSPPPMRRIASGMRTYGREVESKSIDDVLRKMDKDALG